MWPLIPDPWASVKQPSTSQNPVSFKKPGTNPVDFRKPKTKPPVDFKKPSTKTPVDFRKPTVNKGASLLDKFKSKIKASLPSARNLGRAAQVIGLGYGAKQIADGDIEEGLIEMSLASPGAMGLMMLEGSFRPVADGTLEGALNDPRLTPQQKRATLLGIQQSADLRGSITPGSMQPAATNLGEGAAFDAAERFRTGKGYPAGVSRPSDYPVQFNPENAIPPVPELSLSDQLQQERATLGLTPMQQWAMANKGLAQKVGENQSGYDEIQAYFEAQDTERTPKDQLAINRDGVERVFDGSEMTSTPLAGRNIAAPRGDFEQYGTQMSGGSNPFASIALPGTTQGLSQLFLTSGQVQMPDSSAQVNVDDIYGLSNSVAESLEMERFLPFPNIDTEPEFNRITNIVRRKK